MKIPKQTLRTLPVENAFLETIISDSNPWEFFDSNKTSTDYLNSKFVSISLNNIVENSVMKLSAKNLSVPIQIKFKPSFKDNSQHQCRFWDKKRNQWSEEGIQTKRISSTEI